MNDLQRRWPTVGRQVEERMLRLAMSQADLARASGLSANTIRRITGGEGGNFRASNLARLALALGWPPDAIERLLAGEDPAGFDEPPTPPPGGTVTRLPRPTPSADDVEVVELAALVGKLDPGQRQAIEQLIRTMIDEE